MHCHRSLRSDAGWCVSERITKRCTLLLPLPLSRCSLRDLESLAEVIPSAPREVAGRRSKRSRSPRSFFFSFAPRGRKESEGSHRFLDSGAGTRLFFRRAFSRLALRAPSPRHGTHDFLLSAIQWAKERERDGKRAKKSKRSASISMLFSRFCSVSPRSRRAFFFSLHRSKQISLFLTPSPSPPSSSKNHHSSQTSGKSPRSTAAPPAQRREPPRRTLPRPSWSAKSRPTGSSSTTRPTTTTGKERLIFFLLLALAFARRLPVLR